MEHNGKAHAEDLIQRCNKKLEFWSAVYELIGVEMQYREPTVEELKLYVTLYAKKYL